MLLQEIFNFIIFLLLQLFKLLLGLLNNLFDFWVDHHLLHFETHLGLEAESAKFALGLANRHFVVLHCRGRFSARALGC